MRTWCVAFTIVVVSALPLVSASADINPYTNPGFETGDFTGWAVSPNFGIGGSSAQVLTSWTGLNLTYSPTEGSYFAVLSAPPAGITGRISQVVNVHAGDVLCGYAGLDSRSAGNLSNGIEEAFASILIWDTQNTLVATPWSATQLLNSGPLTFWSWTAPADDMYGLEYNLYVYSSTGNAASAIFDAGLSSDPTVPEPGTWALFMVGLTPAGLWLRRRRRA